MNIERGKLYYVRFNKEIEVDLNEEDDIDENGNMKKSHLQRGIRPAIIVSNDMNNKHCPTFNVLPITSKLKRTDLPVHVLLKNTRMPKPSMVLAEGITTVDYYDILEEIGTVSELDMMEIDLAMFIQQGMFRSINYIVKSLKSKMAV